MTKKQEEEKVTDLARATDLSSSDAWLAKPEDVLPTGDLTGTEGIGLDEIRLPRLAIAQGLSPEIASENPIDGLKLYDMFNDLTREIYGRGPLHFIICNREVKFIEFKPREDGGGVVDLNVPANDPRTLWSKVNGERVPPVATKFVEFVVMLLREGKQPEPIMLSIKDTNKWNRAASTNLSSFIALSRDAIYGGIYKVNSRPEKNDSGTFGVYSIEKIGKSSPTIRDYAKKFAESLKGKQIVVNRDAHGDEDIDETPTNDGDASFEPARF